MSRATERYPHKIHATVYLAGAMLTSGTSQSENAEEVFRDTSKDAQLNFGNGERNPPTSLWPSLDVVTRAYYNCCSPEVGTILLLIPHILKRNSCSQGFKCLGENTRIQLVQSFNLTEENMLNKLLQDFNLSKGRILNNKLFLGFNLPGGRILNTNLV